MGKEGKSDITSDRRVSKRISGEYLPEILKNFNVDLGTGEILPSRTLDAGVKGLSLLVPLHIYKIKNYNITLYAADNSFTINDEIVYIKGISPEHSRVSIMFTSKSEGLDKYLSLLDPEK